MKDLTTRLKQASKKRAGVRLQPGEVAYVLGILESLLESGAHGATLIPNGVMEGMDPSGLSEAWRRYYQDHPDLMPEPEWFLDYPQDHPEWDPAELTIEGVDYEEWVRAARSKIPE